MLSLEDENRRTVTPKAYLERVLKEQIKGRTAESIQVGRQLITQTFEERDCVTIPRPVDSEEELRNINNLHFDELRDEFKEGVIHVRELISRSKLKKVRGRNIKGKELLKLLEAYVRGINEGSLPSVPNT